MMNFILGLSITLNLVFIIVTIIFYKKFSNSIFGNMKTKSKKYEFNDVLDFINNFNVGDKK